MLKFIICCLFVNTMCIFATPTLLYIQLMPRPKQERKIVAPPLMQGYKPFGIVRKDLEPVVLQYDEYETIRLLDYVGLHQDQAAKRMNISRPTLTRIYEQARISMAKALVEGRMFVIEGGSVQFDQEWYRCRRCFKLVEGKENHIRCAKCENFDEDELVPVQEPNL